MLLEDIIGSSILFSMLSPPLLAKYKSPYPHSKAIYHQYEFPKIHNNIAIIVFAFQLTYRPLFIVICLQQVIESLWTSYSTTPYSLRILVNH